MAAPAHSLAGLICLVYCAAGLIWRMTQASPRVKGRFAALSVTNATFPAFHLVALPGLLALLQIWLASDLLERSFSQ